MTKRGPQMESLRKRRRSTSLRSSFEKTDWNWEMKAYEDGYRFGTYLEHYEDENVHQIMNQMWRFWIQETGFKAQTLKQFLSVSDLFCKGYSHATNWNYEDKLLMPTSKEVAAVVAVKDEEDTLPFVLHQLQRLPLNELIIVINGSTDNSYAIAKQTKDAKIIYYSSCLGHDVGRAIGAKVAQSDVILFIDGDIHFDAERLLPFFYAVETNHDVVLNDISPYIGPFNEWDDVTIMKEFLNRVLQRPDLKMNSLTAVPHVLTKQAILQIGYENLAVPPLAHALAIYHGLNVIAVSGVDVVHGNKVRKINVGLQNPVAEMIVGDHIEALYTLMEYEGDRLSFADHIRDRSMVAKLGLYHL